MLAAAKEHRHVKRRPRHTQAGIALPRVDQRTVAAMRYRCLLDSYGAELGGVLSEPEKALIAQIAAMQLRIEALQTEIVEGVDVDADMVIRLSSEHRRLLSNLRGKAGQRAEAQGSELDAYLAANYGAEADDALAAAQPEPATES